MSTPTNNEKARNFQETGLLEADWKGKSQSQILAGTAPVKKHLKGLYILDGPSLNLIYGQREQREVAASVDIYAPPLTGTSVRKDLSVLSQAEAIFSGWGAPLMDETFLNAAPNLRVVFYGAGSIRNFTTPAFWERNILITSAYAANAVPVAEYAVSVILLSLKHFWRFSAEAKQGRGWGDHTRAVLGNFNAKVGLVSCGMIARKTLEFLKPYDMERLVFCPFLTEEEAREMHVRRCTLAEVFKESDVVSIHTPLLPETQGFITGRLIASMKPDSTLINTARGAIINESGMIEVLRQRPDITAVLDVTDPEPPVQGSPLFTLPNVVLTPHIAGSMGTEISRLGRYMVDELHRYIAGETMQWRITREVAATLA